MQHLLLLLLLLTSLLVSFCAAGECNITSDGGHFDVSQWGHENAYAVYPLSIPIDGTNRTQIVDRLWQVSLCTLSSNSICHAENGTAMAAYLFEIVPAGNAAAAGRCGAAFTEQISGWTHHTLSSGERTLEATYTDFARSLTAIVSLGCSNTTSAARLEPVGVPGWKVMRPSNGLPTVELKFVLGSLPMCSETVDPKNISSMRRPRGASITVVLLMTVSVVATYSVVFLLSKRASVGDDLLPELEGIASVISGDGGPLSWFRSRGFVRARRYSTLSFEDDEAIGQPRQGAEMQSGRAFIPIV